MDAWMQHLERYDLLGLHEEAQRVGYRVRVANGWVFHLEYEGGLGKYYERGNGVKVFDDTVQGRKQARAFLQSVARDLAAFRERNS